MKRLFWTVLLLIPLSVAAYDCNITWDANPASENVTHYNVYIDGFKKQDIFGTSTTCNAIGTFSGAHVATVTATNAQGESPESVGAPFSESGPFAPSAPSAPTGLSVIVVP